MAEVVNWHLLDRCRAGIPSQERDLALLLGSSENEFTHDTSPDNCVVRETYLYRARNSRQGHEMGKKSLAPVVEPRRLVRDAGSFGSFVPRNRGDRTSLRHC